MRASAAFRPQGLVGAVGHRAGHLLPALDLAGGDQGVKGRAGHARVAIEHGTALLWLERGPGVALPIVQHPLDRRAALHWCHWGPPGHSDREMGWFAPAQRLARLHPPAAGLAVHHSASRAPRQAEFASAGGPAPSTGRAGHGPLPVGRRGRDRLPSAPWGGSRPPHTLGNRVCLRGVTAHGRAGTPSCTRRWSRGTGAIHGGAPAVSGA